MYLGGELDITHKMIWNRGLVYCRQCGCYAAERVGGLNKPCKMKPQSKKANEGLKRMKNGMHPKPGAELPMPINTPAPNHLSRVLDEQRLVEYMSRL